MYNNMLFLSFLDRSFAIICRSQLKLTIFIFPTKLFHIFDVDCEIITRHVSTDSRIFGIE